MGTKEVYAAQKAASTAKYLSDLAQHAATLAAIGAAQAKGHQAWDVRVAQMDKDAKAARSAKQVWASYTHTHTHTHTHTLVHTYTHTHVHTHARTHQHSLAHSPTQSLCTHRMMLICAYVYV